MFEELNIEDFDYYLPKEKIAVFPLENRTDSKLLVYKYNEITHSVFKNIDKVLDDKYFIIRNSTKVIFARLKCKKITGGKSEILCIEPIFPSNDPQISLSSKKETIWKCMIGGRGINSGTELLIEHDEFKLHSEIIDKEGNIARVKFTWNHDITFAEILNKIGEVPLPPYIDRDFSEYDKNSYQTVYAQNDGSVAAPTAGLHFDDKIISKLIAKNINFYDLTLHVGPGTFLPIAKEIKNHIMHQEMMIISINFLENIYSELLKNKKLVAVGTTTLRTLESLYWYGAMLSIDQNIDFDINQFTPFEIFTEISFTNSLKLILEKHKNDNFITGKTSIFILPGYKIRTTNALITNFHQPKSTLLLLIAAFIGNDERKIIYNEALENNYRFLSYGDSSILFRKEK